MLILPQRARAIRSCRTSPTAVSYAGRVVGLALLGLATLGVSAARAVTGYWTNNNNAAWDNAASWAAGVIPNYAGDIAYFTNNLVNSRSVTITGAVTNGVIFIGDPDGSHTFGISGGTGTNVLDNAGAGAAVTMMAGSSNVTLNVGTLLLKDNLTLTNLSATSPLTISSFITGNRSISVAGGSIGVLLSSSNNYSGGTVLQSGMLRLGNNGALGPGALTIQGGALDANATRTMSNNNVQVWNGDFTYAGSAALNMGLGAVTLGGNRTVTVTTNTLSVGGVIDDGVNTYSLTKAGEGALALAAANTYGGGTILNAGELDINHARAIGTGTLTVNGGAINATVSNMTNLNNNTQIWNDDFVYPGRYSVHLGTGAVTLNSDVYISSPSNIYSMILTVGGSISDGANSYSITYDGYNGGVALGAANTYDGGTVLRGGKLYINHAQALGSGALTIYGGQIDNWSGATISNANNNAQFWNGDFSFYGHNTLHLGAGPVTLGADIVLSNLNNAMTVDGVIDDGVHSYRLAKYGSNGTLALAGANTFGGGMELNAGSLELNHPQALGTGPLTINGGQFTSTTTAGYSNANNNVQFWNGDFALAGGRSVHLGVGAVTMSRSCTVSPQFALLTVGGVISDGGQGYGLTKGGGNILRLTGANTFSGDTLVPTGTVALVGEGALTNSATITITAPGILSVTGRTDKALYLGAGKTLAGTGTNIGQVTVQGGMVNPGVSTPGLITLSSLVLSGGVLRVDFTNASGTAGVAWDMIRLMPTGTGTNDLSGAVAGSVTVQVRCTTALLPNFSQATDGSWMVLDGGSTAGFAADKFVVDDSLFVPGSEGGTWAVSESSGNLYLSYTAPTTPIDLAVSISTKTNGTPTSLVSVGDTYVYAITITNLSSDAAQVYYVTNRLPAGLNYLGCSDGGVHNAGTISWTLSNLAAGGSRTVTVSANSPLQGSFADVAEVWPRREEAAPANNRTTNQLSFFCPNAGVVTNNAPTSVTATNGQSISFTVVAANADCNAPHLIAVGLPSGASFPVVTNSYEATGTFTWPAPSLGSHLVRFYSYNQTKATSTVVTVIHVDQAGQPQTGGDWNSKTNWSVSITDLQVPSSGNATLVWAAVDGITYDIYSSTLPLGGGATWSKVVSGEEAHGVLATANVAAGSMRFYQVIPQGQSRSDRGVWGVVRPSIPSSLHLLSPPVLSDRSLADDGAFGQALAAAVPEGAQIHLATDATPTWATLEKVGGVWRTEPGGAEYTTPLEAGQAFYLQGAQGSSPIFAGPVGNVGTQSMGLAVGYNLLGVSEGRGLPASTAFGDAAMTPNPVGNDDYDQGDQLWIQHSNGNWRWLVRLSNGTWYDMTSRSTTAVTLMPGEAYYYIRRTSTATVDF